VRILCFFILQKQKNKNKNKNKKTSSDTLEVQCLLREAPTALLDRESMALCDRLVGACDTDSEATVARRELLKHDVATGAVGWQAQRKRPHLGRAAGCINQTKPNQTNQTVKSYQTIHML
jgi:hypothetical protein